MSDDHGAVSAGLMARYPSPLRYPGGKGKVANFLKAVVLENSLSEYEYVEPYAGGASVALSLLYEDYVQAIHINDLNPGVYAFWKLAVSDPDTLCRRINDALLTIDEWRYHRDTYRDPSSGEDDLGFATFYLNRTNRSGIISRGSVIGGLDQTGPWKIDARFNKAALCARVRKIERFASRITVTRLDALHLIKQDASSACLRFFYLDPPYYVKGSRLYDNSYDHSDHVAIRNALMSLESPWLVSYDAAPEVLALHSAWHQLRYSLAYSASDTANGSEVMFFSKNLSIPPGLASPAAVSQKQLHRLLEGSSI